MCVFSCVVYIYIYIYIYIVEVHIVRGREDSYVNH